MTDLIVTLTKAAERDPEGTAMLIDLAMYDLAVEEMKHIPARKLRSMLRDNAMEQVAKAKVGLVRSYVSKAVGGQYPEVDYLKRATWLTGIEAWLEVEKADWETWNTNNGQLRRQVQRNEHGRFMSINASRPVAGTDKASFDTYGRLRPVAERTEEDPSGTIQRRSGVAPEEEEALNRFQGAFEAAVRNANEAKKVLGSETANSRVELTLGDGSSETVPLEWLADPTSNQSKLSNVLGSLDQHITGMQIVPSKHASEEARLKAMEFNGLGVLGQFAQVARQNKTGVRQFLTPRGPNESRSQVAMGRIGIAGQIMETADLTGTAGKIGLLARYIGAFGPEASRVLQPHMRRGAYRYRGTERTPDQQVVEQLHGDVGSTVDAAAKTIDSGVSAEKVASQIKAPGPKSEWNEPGYQAIRSRALLEPSQTGDSLKLGARSDIVAAELLKTLPKNSLIDTISRESQRGLPSQGVLLDRDGEVVSQSVGAGPDHYLPFNLANLGKLRGGQYIRTRQSGGLTGEDVFTTVFSGARSATVASGSGVFRIEMAPDFRGGRALSDKAASMYDTYLNILNTIDTKNLYTKPLGEEVEQELQEEAKRLTGQPVGSEAQKAKFKDLEKAKLQEATTITVKDRKDIADRAAANNPDDPDGAKAQIEQEMYDLRQEKMSVVNLNGDGYALALQTLKEQYPYFIRKVEYQPLRGNPKYDKEEAGAKTQANLGSQGFLSRLGLSPATARARGGTDANYVRPGQEPWRGDNTIKPPAAAATATPPPTGGAGGAPAAAGGGNTPAAPGAPAGTTSTGSPAAQNAAANAKLSSGSAIKARNEFIRPFIKVLGAAASANPPPNARGTIDANADFADMKDDSLSEQIEWLLRRPSEGDLGEMIRLHPEQAFKALSASKDDWNGALQSVFATDGINEVASTQNIFGATTVPELVDATRARAKHMLDIEMRGQPFATNTPDALLNTTGQAIDFDEITSAPDKNTFEARLETDEFKEFLPMVAELGVDEKGNSQSLTDAGEKMGVIIGGLKKLEDTRKSLASGPPAQRARSVNDVMAGLGLDKDFEAASGLDKVEIARLLNLDSKSPDKAHEEREIVAQAEKWQKARTILEVARAYDIVSGGGAFPKAWEAIVPKWVKASQPGVTHRQRVEKASSLQLADPRSPVARQVVLRKALGLPLVRPKAGSTRF
jgi:hypothetical protein